MTRIATYSQWKADLAEKIVNFPVWSLEKFNQSILEVFGEYAENNKGPDFDIDIDELYCAFMKLFPNKTPADELFNVPDDFVNSCKNVFDQLKADCGLQPIWVEQDLSEPNWKCTIHFSCPEWQEACEKAIGCSIDLVILLEMVDEDIFISIPDLCLFEAPDLLTLHYTAEGHWRGPNTLLALQKQY